MYDNANKEAMDPVVRDTVCERDIGLTRCPEECRVGRFDCGGENSAVDEFGCYRKSCVDDADWFVIHDADSSRTAAIH